MADEAVTKQLEENRARSEESRKQAAELLSKGKPTPTQEENDRASLGEHVLEKEDDGSGPEMHTRDMEPSKAGPYQTRPQQPAARPQRPAPPKPE
jgi:hypothetical protein